MPTQRPWHRVVVAGAVLGLVGCRGCPPDRHKVSESLGGQSETAVNTSNFARQQVITVTYNDGSTDPKIQYTATKRTVLAGASLMGFSYSTNGGTGWTYGGKVTPSSDWPILWGDPAITTPFGNQAYVFISNLAVPKGKYPQGGVVSDSGGNGFYGAIGGACIARSTNGGKSFAVYQCFGNEGHFYDGGSLAASASGEIFAAYVDVNTDQIDVWRSPSVNGSFTRIAAPFPNASMASHARLRFDNGTNSLYIAATNSNTFVMMNRFQSGAWGTPVFVSDSSVIYPTINLSDRVLRTGPQFAFDIGAPGQFEHDERTQVAEDPIRILYTRRDPATGRLYIAGSFCTLDLAKCWNSPAWATGAPGDVWHKGDTFNPNLRAFPGFFGIEPAWRANYTTRDTNPTGNEVKLKQGNLVTLQNGFRVFLSFDLTQSQVVCPDKRGYWGDYDDLQFTGVTEASTPKFLRAFTDSFGGCSQRTTYESKEVHTSVAVHPE